MTFLAFELSIWLVLVIQDGHHLEIQDGHHTKNVFCKLAITFLAHNIEDMSAHIDTYLLSGWQAFGHTDMCIG